MKARAEPAGLAQWTAYFVRLGAIGFGGPVALAGAMERDLVRHRQWVTPDEFRQGLALAKLSPGPLAAQLAIYLGWLRHGVRGATAVAIAFILPSFLLVTGFAALYLPGGGYGWLSGFFRGAGPAVSAIVAFSAWPLMRASVGRDRLLWALLAVSFAVCLVGGAWIVWLFPAAGLMMLGARWRPDGRRALAFAPAWLLLAGASSPGGVLWHFLQAGALAYGSGLAILPFLHAGVVEQHGWLTERQFLDCVSLGMITPGPLLTSVAFIGYGAAGWWGAVAATAGIFLPCYAVTVLGAPVLRRHGGHPGVRAFIDGVTAAAAGSLAAGAVLLGRGAINDAPAAAIGVGAALLIWRTRIPAPLLIALAGAAGMLMEVSAGGS